MHHIDKEFVLAGKATFTVEVPEGAFKTSKPHYTFKVTRKEADGRWPEAYFVKLLTGPDNESSYTYLGKLEPKTGVMFTTAKSAMPPEALPVRLLNRILANVWAGTHDAYESKGFKTHHAGACGRCGRKLTTPESTERGYGPECIHYVMPQFGPALALVS